MTSKKSDTNNGTPERLKEVGGSGPAEDRKTRLAAQLRENLKKRKELARARKSRNDDSN